MLKIFGAIPLSGEVTISGSKNSVLPCMAASLLTNESVSLQNVPNVTDMQTMISILQALNVKVTHSPWKKTLYVSAAKISDEIPQYLSSQIRGSVLLIGSILTRTGFVRLSGLGGCQIGNRPIDFHIKAFRQMGAKIKASDNCIELKGKQLKAIDTSLRYPSVGATENVIMAATLAKGVTSITNIAIEPEVLDLVSMLNSMGSEIAVDTKKKTAQITGVKSLGGTKHRLIPDRIEAGTYAVASCITEGELTLMNVDTNHLGSINSALQKMSIDTQAIGFNRLRILKPEGSLAPASISTAPYPRFPTDMQPQFTALATRAKGKSKIIETIFNNRFHHIAELNKLGAKITRNGRCIEIEGPTYLEGCNIMAKDLRGGAALVLAGLSATGTTEIDGTSHINRGYEDMIEKLRKVGAHVEQNQ